MAAGRNPNREDALRDFRRQSAKFRKITPAELRTIRDVSGRGNYDDRVPGLVLASQLSGYYVFRTALIAVVLSMAVGRNASLLCQVWCDPALAAASGCHRQSDSTDLPSLVGHGCDDKAPSGALFLKEDMRRSVSAPDSDHAILVLRYQFAPTTTGLPPADEPGHLPSLEKRPLDTALRI